MTSEPSERNSPAVEAAWRAAPDNVIAEILDGELYTQPRPARPHTRAASTLGMKLGPPFQFGDRGPGGWVILFEPELHLGRRPDILVPDLAGWRRQRMPANAPDDHSGELAYYDTAPDWVCEVISERTEANDRGRKRRIYRRERVGHLWLIVPPAQTLEVYRLHEGRWVEIETYTGDVVVRAEPFDAIELDLAVLWAR